MRCLTHLSWMMAFFVLFWSAPCDAQEQPNGDKETAKRTEANMDYQQLVASLANRNPQPKIVGEVPDEKPLFAKNYDWKEQDRVLKVIQTLVDHAEDAWPALIDHLDDQQYCITFEHEESVTNHSVGGICFMLLGENLTAAYMPHIPADELAYRKLKRPDVISFARFKPWCREQHDKGRALYELQVETCQWAIEKMPELTDVPGEERREAVAQIQKEIEELRTTKKPVLISKITLPDSRVPYSAKKAERIRTALESK